MKTVQNSAPFGIATKRFSPIGFHPDLDKTGCLKKDKLKLGPGQYNPKEYQCPYKTSKGKSSWQRKQDVEEFSANLGYRNARILEERKFWKSQGGPGNYEITDYLYKRQTSSCKTDVMGGALERFHSFIKHDNPPPDTYFRNIFKTTKYKKPSTTIPTFEWDGFVDRMKGDNQNWKKAPNRYDPKDVGSIDAKLAKVVSKRGPYELFTGPRDGTTIKNYFAPPSFKGPLNWFYTWPNELQNLLHHPKKKHYGVFLKANRFPKKPTLRMMLNDISMCYKDPSHPSPAHYFTDMSKTTIGESKHAFNLSTKYARPPLEWRIYPGVGRYSPKQPKCLKQKAESCVFKSKTTRTIFKVEDYNSF